MHIIDCALPGANVWTGFNYLDRANPGGDPICANGHGNKFNFKPERGVPTLVQIDLSSVQTRGRLTSCTAYCNEH